MLDEVEERRLTPLEIVEDDHERVFQGVGLEQLAESELRFLRGRADHGVDLRSQLHHDLDERPVRDSLPVVEATSS